MEYLISAECTEKWNATSVMGQFNVKKEECGLYLQRQKT